MKKVRVKVLRNNKWKIENKLVLKKGKIYVLKNESLRLEIIQLYYNILIARHEGWPEVTKKVKQYMEKYNQYQRMKNKAEMLTEKLRPTTVLERLQQHILVDFIMKLLLVQLRVKAQRQYFRLQRNLSLLTNNI